MAEFRVIWSIDLDANSVEGAADEALAIMRDPGAIATHFEVIEKASGVRWEVDGERPIGQRTKVLPFSWAKLLAHKLGVRTDH